MKDKFNLTGQVFNNLEVLRFSEIKNTNSHWICRCLLCDSETEVSRPNLKSGNTKDCGCMRSDKLSEANKIHGACKTRTWKSWSRMRRRIRLGSKHSPIYGKISICPTWDNFEVFLKDMGERPKDATLDRIDNNKGYSKENCRWATQAEQNRNKSNNVILEFNGKKMCATDWAKELNINRDTIRERIKRGLPIEKVLHVGRVDSVK